MLLEVIPYKSAVTGESYSAIVKVHLNAIKLQGRLRNAVVCGVVGCDTVWSLP
jgi:hypothetical protein